MMAGLLDLLQSGDPTVQRGLLQFGLSLLQSKGSFGNALGQAGQVGVAGADQFRNQQEALKRADLNNQSIQNQLQQQQHQLKIQNLPQQFSHAPPSGPDGQGPSGFDAQGYLGALAGLDPMMAIQQRQAMRKEAPAPIKLGRGDQLLDPATFQPIASNEIPDKPASLPNAVQEYQFAQGQGFKGSFSEWVTQKARAGAASNSVVNYAAPVPFLLPDGTVGYAQPGNRAGAQPQVMTDPSGKPMVKPAEPKDKDLTEAQAKATTYLGQMKSATKALSEVGADQTRYATQAETMMSGGPLNLAAGQKAQRIKQAQDQWSEAFLRYKTGAASTPAEVAANRKTFFPTFGDKPEQVAQKKAMRDQAEKDMEISAGRGAAVLNKRDGADANDDPLGLRK